MIDRLARALVTRLRVCASVPVLWPWHGTHTPCRLDRSFVPPLHSGTMWSMWYSTGILLAQIAHTKSCSCNMRKRDVAENRFRFIFF
jgi:hypothetical protein